MTGNRYNGQYRLAALRLDYYGARWYDPSLGRWAQADSVVPLASQEALAWDRYAYTNNNPVRYNDPSGHMISSGCDIEGCTIEKIHQEASSRNTTSPRETQTPSLVWRSGPTIPPTIFPQWRQGPTSTPTPTPFPVTISAGKKAEPPFYIHVDWSKVDYIDLVIDGGGIVLELAGGVALFFGQPEITAGTEIAQGVLEGVGFVKSGYEVITGDPSSLLVQTTTKAVQASALVWRLERLIPVVGLIGNGVSLYINLEPQIEWR